MNWLGLQHGVSSCGVVITWFLLQLVYCVNILLQLLYCVNILGGRSKVRENCTEKEMERFYLKIYQKQPKGVLNFSCKETFREKQKTSFLPKRPFFVTG